VIATRETAAVVVKGFRTTVVDTTGAGDVHNGVFLAQLAQGLDPVEAARYANAAAAMSVALAGPATSPTRLEVEAFFDSERRTTL
jgi:sugar/nucleoside kinase (ribokinase family)